VNEIKVGDVCEIIADFGGEHEWTIGLECTVVSPFAMQMGIWTKREGIINKLGWVVDIDGQEFVAALGELRKKMPPADQSDEKIPTLTEVWY
jgi:hypothetical protein